MFIHGMSKLDSGKSEWFSEKSIKKRKNSLFGDTKNMKVQVHSTNN